MRVTDEFLKGTTFICTPGDDVPKATAFLVKIAQSNYEFYYFATARHVVERLLGQLILRVSRVDGGTVDVTTNREDWVVSEQADVAIWLQTGEEDAEGLDLIAIPAENFCRFERYFQAQGYLDSRTFSSSSRL